MKYAALYFLSTWPKAIATHFSCRSIDALARAMPNSALEGRILLYFADTDVQRAISGSALAHDVRRDTERVDVAYNNWSGNKFDYYQHLGLTPPSGERPPALFD